MRFYFRSYIDVSEDFIDTVVNRVKNGENFYEVFDEEASCWDDFEYYSSGFIENRVRKIVMKRVKEN